MYLKSQHYYNLAWNIIKSMKYQQQKKYLTLIIVEVYLHSKEAGTKHLI